MPKKPFHFLLCLCISVAILLSEWNCKAKNQKQEQFDISTINFTDGSAGVDTLIVVKKDKSIFRLNYTSAGLGSNFCSMQPVFEVTGTTFIYTSQQTSFYEESKRRKTDTICSGKFKSSSIDSILDLVDEIKEPVVYRTNIHIMSGGIHFISVSKNNIDIEFTLHNATDPIAQKIIDILNTYIPANEKKLWLFDIPEDISPK